MVRGVVGVLSAVYDDRFGRVLWRRIGRGHRRRGITRFLLEVVVKELANHSQFALELVHLVLLHLEFPAKLKVGNQSEDREGRHSSFRVVRPQHIDKGRDRMLVGLRVVDKGSQRLFGRVQECKQFVPGIDEVAHSRRIVYCMDILNLKQFLQLSIQRVELGLVLDIEPAEFQRDLDHPLVHLLEQVAWYLVLDGLYTELQVLEDLIVDTRDIVGIPVDHRHAALHRSHRPLAVVGRTRFIRQIAHRVLPHFGELSRRLFG
jgi:hypothetical protein